MHPSASAPGSLATQPVLRWFVGWWRVLRFAALMLTLAATPSSYREGRWSIVATHLVRGVGGALGWFTLIAALMTLVITRIVLVTAFSYGLSQYALEMVIRVLVLELIPLIAALFVAVRSALPAGGEITTMRRRGELDAQARAGRDPLQHELLPRALASLFLVALLATAAAKRAVLSRNTSATGGDITLPTVRV
jgi:phospholipid/cholesterol/gamma-HCH transport system permease protein